MKIGVTDNNQQRRDEVDQNLQGTANAVAKKRGSGNAAFWKWLDRIIDASGTFAKTAQQN